MNKLLSFLLLSVALLLSACSTIFPSDYVVRQERLSAKLAEKFPLSREAGRGVLSYRVTLDSPELGFLAEQNRMSLAVHFSATTALRVALDGRIALSGSLRYDTEQRAIYLQDATVDSLQARQDFAGVLELLRPQLTRMLNDYLKENPVYRVDPEDLKFHGVMLEIESVDVVGNGIRFKFVH